MHYYAIRLTWAALSPRGARVDFHATRPQIVSSACMQRVTHLHVTPPRRRGHRPAGAPPAAAVCGGRSVSGSDPACVARGTA